MYSVINQNEGLFGDFGNDDYEAEPAYNTQSVNYFEKFHEEPKDLSWDHMCNLSKMDLDANPITEFDDFLSKVDKELSTIKLNDEQHESLFENNAQASMLDKSTASLNPATNTQTAVNPNPLSCSVDESKCSDLDYQSEVKSSIKKNRRCNYYRWGSKDDKHAFSRLSEMLAESNISIDDFLKCRNITEDKFNIMNKVAKVSKWRSHPMCLYERFYRLTLKQEFSVRQTKLLRRLIRKQLQNEPEIDFDSLAIHFPGKFIRSLKEYVKNDSIIQKML